jgi:hypothetical protein
MSNAEHTKRRIPLDVAGKLVIDYAFGYIHVFKFEDASGVAVLDAEIEVSFSANEEDFLPLAYNNKIATPAERGVIRWNAQPGVTAIVTIAKDAGKFFADTPNPKQLVVASGGTSLTNAAVTVGTAEVLLAAADPTRQSVTIQNLGAADVYVGATGLTTATGVKLASGGAITLDKQTAAIYGISGSAGQDVRVLTEAS